MSSLPTNSALGRAVQVAVAGTAVSSRRHRRWIAVNALVEVFNLAATRGVIPSFIVKGGFALEFRFRGEARASRDVDIVLALDANEILNAVIEVLRIEWSGFSFRIKGTPERRQHSYGFEVNASYQNRDWSTFELELVFGEVRGQDIIEPLDLTAYGLLRATGIPCMTVAEQVAQKLHAVSDPAENRPRDLIDIYLCVTRVPTDEDELRSVCARVFEERASHPWPPNIEIREQWRETLQALIIESELDLTVDDRKHERYLPSSKSR